jgi:hypothetical protein
MSRIRRVEAAIVISPIAPHLNRTGERELTMAGLVLQPCIHRRGKVRSGRALGDVLRIDRETARDLALTVAAACVRLAGTLSNVRSDIDSMIGATATSQANITDMKHR